MFERPKGLLGMSRAPGMRWNYMSGVCHVRAVKTQIPQLRHRLEVRRQRSEREAWPVQCSKVVFGCERQSLAKRRIAPPKDLRRLRMSIGNHFQQEVRAA
jgi:hypothetical protein